MRRLLVFVMLAAVAVGTAGLAVAQNQSSSTPTAEMCATPSGSPAASPAAVMMASPVQVPGGQEQQVASPTVLYPCPSPAAAGAMATAVTITMVDIAFQPNAVTIPANTDVTVTLPNQGATVHTFDIDELGIATGDVQPGSSTTVTINAPAGTYEFYCAIPGHREAGMVGTLTVQ